MPSSTISLSIGMICSWRLRRRAAVSLTHACRRTCSLRECHPTVVSYVSSTILDCFVCTQCTYHSLDTNTKFLDNLLLNELLDLFGKCAAVKDVASVRVYNCNVALTVKFARADQSYVDICLLTLECHSIPVLSRSLYAQASTVGDEFT